MLLPPVEDGDALEIDLEEDEDAFEDNDDEQTIDVTFKKVYGCFATVMANVYEFKNGPILLIQYNAIYHFLKLT